MLINTCRRASQNPTQLSAGFSMPACNPFNPEHLLSYLNPPKPTFL